MSDYRKQASDLQLAACERIAALPDLVSALDAAGADVAALVSLAESDLALRLNQSTRRTEFLPSMRTAVNGAVPVARTFGRGTDADAYEVLAGAPVGSVETLRTQLAEAVAAANDAAWVRRNAWAESGHATSRANRNTARRRAARARK